MKRIKLNNGKHALIDDEDFNLVKNYKWRIANGYAISGKILMHRLILNSKPREYTDHINQNRLDNQRQNLRKCTQSQNQQNRPAYKNNKVGYKGVVRHRNKNIWLARITYHGVRVNLGSYKDPISAAQAYNEAALQVFGEYAYLNNMIR